MGSFPAFSKVSTPLRDMSLLSDSDDACYCRCSHEVRAGCGFPFPVSRRPGF